jgi:competence protein ComEA
MDAVKLYGDFTMMYSHQIQTHGRAGIPARDILAFHRRGGIGALFLMLLVAVVVLAGSPSVFAQEQKAAATPAVAKQQKPAVAAEATTKVNINTADAQTLAANLKGVGEARAMEIVRYREAYGPFASAEELTEVKGIGPSTLEMNRDTITLE